MPHHSRHEQVVVWKWLHSKHSKGPTFPFYSLSFIIFFFSHVGLPSSCYELLIQPTSFTLTPSLLSVSHSPSLLLFFCNLSLPFSFLLTFSVLSLCISLSLLLSLSVCLTLHLLSLPLSFCTISLRSPLSLSPSFCISHSPSSRPHSFCTISLSLPLSLSLTLPYYLCHF